MTNKQKAGGHFTVLLLLLFFLYIFCLCYLFIGTLYEIDKKYWGHTTSVLGKMDSQTDGRTSGWLLAEWRVEQQYMSAIRTNF